MHQQSLPFCAYTNLHYSITLFYAYLEVPGWELVLDSGYSALNGVSGVNRCSGVTVGFINPSANFLLALLLLWTSLHFFLWAHCSLFEATSFQFLHLVSISLFLWVSPVVSFVHQHHAWLGSVSAFQQHPMVGHTVRKTIYLTLLSVLLWIATHCLNAVLIM